MKIKDLIKELWKYNPEADITLKISEDICLAYICKDPNTDEELTPETTMQVFIEPADFCPSCSHEYVEGDVRMCSFYDCPCREVKECFQYEESDDS